MKTSLLLVCGLYHVGFIIFHLRFQQIFRWGSDLKKLSFVNQQIMPILNWCLTFLFVAFTYLMLFETSELAMTRLGGFLLWIITGFWIFRFILQFVYFGWKNKRSNLFASLLFLGAVLMLMATVMP